VRISGNSIFDNNVGLNMLSGGRIVSFGDNRIGGNTTDNPPTQTISKSKG
jgi:hypothetical protein